MRQIGDGLRDLLKLHAAKFIQQKGKYDSEWKFQDTFDHTDCQCILDQSWCIIAGKEGLEIFQTDPWASPDSFLKGIILKCKNRTRHRHIADQCIVDDTWNQHHIQRPVTYQSFLQRLFFGLYFLAFSTLAAFIDFLLHLLMRLLYEAAVFLTMDISSGTSGKIYTLKNVQYFL